MSGNFELNGYPWKLNDLRKISTYIPQEFSMLPLLTVRETMEVAIDLKLPQNHVGGGSGRGNRKEQLVKESESSI